MNELLGSDIFQFLVLLVSIIGGTGAVAWRIATFSAKIMTTVEQNKADIIELKKHREADVFRIHKLELSKP